MNKAIAGAVISTMTIFPAFAADVNSVAPAAAPTTAPTTLATPQQAPLVIPLHALKVVQDARDTHTPWQEAADQAVARIQESSLKSNVTQQVAALAPKIAKLLLEKPERNAMVTVAVYKERDSDRQMLAAVAFEGRSDALNPSFYARILSDTPQVPGKPEMADKLELDPIGTSYLCFFLEKGDLNAADITQAQMKTSLALAVQQAQQAAVGQADNPVYHQSYDTQALNREASAQQLAQQRPPYVPQADQVTSSLTQAQQANAQAQQAAARANQSAQQAQPTADAQARQGNAQAQQDAAIANRNAAVADQNALAAGQDYTTSYWNEPSDYATPYYGVDGWDPWVTYVPTYGQPAVIVRPDFHHRDHHHNMVGTAGLNQATPAAHHEQGTAVQTPARTGSSAPAAPAQRVVIPDRQPAPHAVSPAGHPTPAPHAEPAAPVPHATPAPAPAPAGRK